MKSSGIEHFLRFLLTFCEFRNSSKDSFRNSSRIILGSIMLFITDYSRNLLKDSTRRRDSRRRFLSKLLNKLIPDVLRRLLPKFFKRFLAEYVQEFLMVIRNSSKNTRFSYKGSFNNLGIQQCILSRATSWDSKQEFLQGFLQVLGSCRSKFHQKFCKNSH